MDIVGRGPDGKLFALEVNTGKRPDFTEGQLAVYPHLSKGGVLQSPDAKAVQLGWPPGVPLPPIYGVLLYQLDGSGTPKILPIP
jgi:hypothetical protein